jgi:Domain of unknown function (DUF5666)
MRNRRLIRGITMALVTGVLAACGGGSSDGGGDGASSTSAVGTLSGFGSLYVNGVGFDTGGATFRVDDEDRFDDSALAVGMKVKVQGTINGDGMTGTATSIFYDDDVEGPVDVGSLITANGTAKTFTVFGLMVSADASRTVFDGGAGFDTLAEGQKLEISGYFDGRQIVATRIEKQDDLDDEFELKGTVADYDGATIALTLQNGVGAGPFDVSPAATLNIPADPVGRFVEVKLREQSGALVVTGIETEDEEAVTDGEKVSIGGILSEDGSGGLLINGMPFTVNDNTGYQPARLEGALAAGMEVRIMGVMQDGVLVAGKIETGDGRLGIAARVVEISFSDAKNGSVTVGLGNGQSLAVRTGNGTQFVDDSGADVDADASFRLDELVAGTDFVELRAYRNDAAQLVATRIMRQDAGQETRLEAPVESFTADVSVTLLGITWTVDAGTLYELNAVASDAANFFGAMHAGDMVKVRDVEPDGAADRLHRDGESTGPGPSPDPGPVADLAGIQVSFKLDPRITNSTYMGERWVSPPTYTRVQEPGKPLTVDARVSGIAANGGLVAISPAWIPSDPGLVSVSPDQGDQVLITVLGVGQSSLLVTTQGVSRDLFINAMPYLDNTLLVEISR